MPQKADIDILLWIKRNTTVHLISKILIFDSCTLYIRSSDTYMMEMQILCHFNILLNERYYIH